MCIRDSYRKDLGIYEARTTAGSLRPDAITSPFWGQMVSGFVGERNTSTSGLLLIDFNADHGYNLGLKTKPIVLLTVDPTDSSGGIHTNNIKQKAWANVRRFLDASGAVSAPQTGTAGSGSGTSGGYGVLKAQGAAGNSDAQSYFTASLAGNTVYKLDGYGQVVGTGVVQAVSDAATVTTTGDATHVSPTTSWASGDRYVIDADIHRVEIQAFYPANTISTAGGLHRNALLINDQNEYATSEPNITDEWVQFGKEADTKIGIMYQIIPRPHAFNVTTGILSNIPFTDVYGNDS